MVSEQEYHPHYNGSTELAAERKSKERRSGGQDEAEESFVGRRMESGAMGIRLSFRE